MTSKKVDEPIVNLIRHVQLCHLFKKGIVSDSVKCLTEIQRNDYDKWVYGEKVGYSLKE